MLVLSRKLDESIVIGDGIKVTVVDIRGDKVRLGIEIPTFIAPSHKQAISPSLGHTFFEFLEARLPKPLYTMHAPSCRSRLKYAAPFLACPC